MARHVEAYKSATGSPSSSLERNDLWGKRHTKQCVMDGMRLQMDGLRAGMEESEGDKTRWSRGRGLKCPAKRWEMVLQGRGCESQRWGIDDDLYGVCWLVMDGTVNASVLGQEETGREGKGRGERRHDGNGQDGQDGQELRSEVGKWGQAKHSQNR